MKILIIGAMRVEIDEILNELKNTKVKTCGNFEFFTGNIGNVEVVLVESGIGKVMAGILIATAFNNFNEIDYVINLGVAGGYGGVKIGDIISGENYIYGDVDVTSFDKYHFGQIPRFEFPLVPEKLLFEKSMELGANPGTICTMDRFIENDDFIKPIIDKHFNGYNIKCFDMESAAFAQSCAFYGMKFIAIRAISDIVSSKNVEESYTNNLELASKKSSEFVIKLINNI